MKAEIKLHHLFKRDYQAINTESVLLLVFLMVLLIELQLDGHNYDFKIGFKNLHGKIEVFKLQRKPINAKKIIKCRILVDHGIIL